MKSATKNKEKPAPPMPIAWQCATCLNVAGNFTHRWMCAACGNARPVMVDGA